MGTVHVIALEPYLLDMGPGKCFAKGTCPENPMKVRGLRLESELETSLSSSGFQWRLCSHLEFVTENIGAWSSGSSTLTPTLTRTLIGTLVTNLIHLFLSFAYITLNLPLALPNPNPKPSHTT